jgi:hypothetical protein
MDLGAKYIAAKATPNSSQNRNEHSLSVRHIDGKTVLVVLTELGRERLDAARPIHAEISSAESVVADHVERIFVRRRDTYGIQLLKRLTIPTRGRLKN